MSLWIVCGPHEENHVSYPFIFSPTAYLPSYCITATLFQYIPICFFLHGDLRLCKEEVIYINLHNYLSMWMSVDKGHPLFVNINYANLDVLRFRIYWHNWSQ